MRQVNFFKLLCKIANFFNFVENPLFRFVPWLGNLLNKLRYINFIALFIFLPVPTPIPGSLFDFLSRMERDKGSLFPDSEGVHPGPGGTRGRAGGWGYCVWGDWGKGRRGGGLDRGAGG